MKFDSKDPITKVDKACTGILLYNFVRFFRLPKDLQFGSGWRNLATAKLTVTRDWIFLNRSCEFWSVFFSTGAKYVGDSNCIPEFERS